MPTALRLLEQNNAFIAGRLTRDPEVRYTQKGQAVARVDVAVNRRYKDAATGEWKDDTAFIPVTVWGVAAERCKERLKKGSPVHVEGRITMESWTDKSGNKRTNLVITSRRVQFLEAFSTQGNSADTAQIKETQIESEPATNSAQAVADLDDVPF